MAIQYSSRKSQVVLYAQAVDTTSSQQDDVIARQRVERVFKRLGATVARYHGQMVDTQDVSFLAEFDRSTDAVVVALAFQDTQREYLEMIDDNSKPEVQIGLAFSEELPADGMVADLGMSALQRLAAKSEPGGVVITAAICEALSEQSPIELDFLGEQIFDGSQKRIEIYRIKLKEGAELPPPPEKARKGRPLQPMGTMRMLNRYLLLLIIAAVIFAFVSASGS